MIPGEGWRWIREEEAQEDGGKRAQKELIACQWAVGHYARNPRCPNAPFPVGADPGKLQAGVPAPPGLFSGELWGRGG